MFGTVGVSRIFDSRRFCNLHFAFRATNLFGNFFARQSATAYFSGEVRLLQQYQPSPETFCNANLHEPLSVSKRIVSQRSGKYRQAIRICLKSAFAVTRQKTLFGNFFARQSATAYFSGKVRLLQQYQPCPETFGNANFVSLFPYQKEYFHNVVASIGSQFVSV